MRQYDDLPSTGKMRPVRKPRRVRVTDEHRADR